MNDKQPACRVLIVEDEPLMREFMRDALAADGEYAWDVVACATAEEARRRLAADLRFDVVSVDIRLPGISGIAFMRWMRQAAINIPAVVVSGADDAETVLKTLELGAADYVLKPFEPRSLCRALGRAAELKRLGAGSWQELELAQPLAGWFEISAPSERDFLFRFRQFSRVLLAAELAPRQMEDLRLAAEELIHNAIEWGNRYDRRKQVKVTFCLFRDRVVVKVEDQGAGFVPEDIADPVADPLAHAENRRKSGKRPGGFGIHLVKAVTDEVIYSRRGNSVLFVKYR